MGYLPTGKYCIFRPWNFCTLFYVSGYVPVTPSLLSMRTWIEFVSYCCVSEFQVVQLCLTLCDPKDYTVHGILQARILEWVAFPFYRGSSQSGIEPRAPIFWADSLPAEPQGNPKSTRVGILFLLQWTFLTQESNHDLLHCRWILYPLSYQGSPHCCVKII